MGGLCPPPDVGIDEQDLSEEGVGDQDIDDEVGRQ